MVSRKPRAHSSEAEIPGRSQLTLAKLIIGAENILRAFAIPFLFIGLFVALAWLGLFKALYPWAHLAALAIFTIFFFDSIGKARAQYKPGSLSLAKRRVEEASGLTHRPLDAVIDRPAVSGNVQQTLWQVHQAQAKSQLKGLLWPRWKLSFAARDPYALRYGLLILLAIGLFTGWGVWGGRLLAAINPDLGKKLEALNPALDAWITPPDYTGLPPIMIATPAGQRHDADTIEVPEGSTITAHLAEQDGEAPKLAVNGKSVGFDTDDHSGYGVSAAIESGDDIAIRRGWRTLGSWHIRVVPDHAPQIAFTEPPSTSEQKSVKLSYNASDDYGVTSVTAKVTPRESLPGASDHPIEIELAQPGAKDVKRVSFEDLTAEPWAGLAVQIQLIARDAMGHIAKSEPAEFTLPERNFFHPLARALIEERKNLLQNPDDNTVRNEAANVMAGIAAHQAEGYRGDPVVLMALRAGAVRLVLYRGHERVPSVSDILWQTAVRIEGGGVGVAGDNLRAAQKELADALDRGADEAEIQSLIDRLHDALSQYLAQLSAQAAAKPASIEDLNQALGARTNMLTPEDLDRMLQQMRDLSASGDHDAAREELAQMQQMLESMRTDNPQLTAEQKEMLGRLMALRELSKKQQQLLDQTFQNQSDATQSRKLAVEQENLRNALRTLMTTGDKNDVDDDLSKTGALMQESSADLKGGNAHGALTPENGALAALQKAIDKRADDLRAAMFMLSRGSGFGQGRDPFGRSGFARDDGTTKVPDKLQARHVREILDELQRRAGEGDRPRNEREYIERLLQNF